jgi:hypothetical protein
VPTLKPNGAKSPTLKGTTMKSILIAATAALVALGACSPMPSAIAPVPAAAGAYAGLSCAEAQQQLAAVSAELAAESNHQTQAAAMDAVGVFLVLVPVSQVTGANHAGTIASLKGKVDALTVQVAASCG